MTAQEAIDYYNKFIIDPRTGFENMCKTYELRNLSIKALEKQIPKEPYRIGAIDSNDNAIVECPICKAGNDTAINAIKHIYCWKCGQAIKWE